MKDPQGGLTAAGRKAFAERDGSHLRPGVQGEADTPEKMKRKGSFLTRHFTNPRGPMLRMASRRGWRCRPMPGASRCRKARPAAKKLAAKGRKLLEQYHAATGTKPAAKRPAKSTAN